MLHKKAIVLLLIALTAAFGVWTATAASLLEQRAVLSGRVVSVVEVGSVVEEGAELVRVSTLAGSATAARATGKGVVKEVLVGEGAEIKSGDVVVRIEAQ